MTPEELRKLTEEGRKRTKAAARANDKRRKKEREAQIQALRNCLPGWRSSIEFQMEKAAKQGSSTASVKIYTKELYDPVDHDMIRPIMEELAESFQIFNAKVRVDHGMTWYSDGAGPGDDDYYIDLSW